MHIAMRHGIPVRVDELGNLSSATRKYYTHGLLTIIHTVVTDSFVYDSAGQRVLKAVTTNDATTYSADVFDSLRLEGATYPDTNGDYARTNQTEAVILSSAGMRLGRVVYSGTDPLSASEGNSPTPTQYVFLEVGDHLGSTSFVIDQATSELVERPTYQGYGAAESDFRTSRWSNFRENSRYTNHEDDAEVGLVYFGHRYYSPILSRWTSPDPLTIHGLGSDLNPYAFVRGSPLGLVDPSGMDPCDKSSQSCQPPPPCNNSNCDDPGPGPGPGGPGPGGNGSGTPPGGGGHTPPPGAGGPGVYPGVTATGPSGGGSGAGPSARSLQVTPQSPPTEGGSLGRTFDVMPTGTTTVHYGSEGPDKHELDSQHLIPDPPRPISTDTLVFIAPIVLAILTEGLGASGIVPATAGGAGPVLQGQAGVRAAIADIEGAGGQILGSDITIEAGGVRTRPDLFVELPNGQQAFIEVKTGSSAGFTPNQSIAYPDIWANGGIPQGANAAAAGLTPGVPIGPTPVWTVYYPWPWP